VPLTKYTPVMLVLGLKAKFCFFGLANKLALT